MAAWLMRLLGHPAVWDRLPETGLLGRLRDRSVQLYLEQNVLPKVMAAQASGQATTQVWAPPGTVAADLLGWFDEQLAAHTPPAMPVLFPVNQFKFFVVRCTAEEWDTAQRADQPVALPADRLVVLWQGHRQDWWTEGRDTIGAQLPADHAGLCLVATGLAPSIFGTVNSSADVGRTAARPTRQR